MDITISPRLLSGSVTAIASKSQAHRFLICAAFGDKKTVLLCPDTNQDMDATAQCLTALGANIQRNAEGFTVTPIATVPKSATLLCGESGSTLRFLLPIAGALGVETTFVMEGRLPQRPLSPLWEEIERMGCHLSRPTENTLLCRGALRNGNYTIDGGVSSQFITGLLFALSLLPGKSTLTITGKTESKPYVAMTKQAMTLFGVNTEDFGQNAYQSPGILTVEGDWSNGAFFLGANAMGNAIQISNLNPDSLQGDKEIIHILPLLKTECPTISVADIPDLVPILAVVAGANHGAVFTEIGRLRLKETDRVETVCAMVNALGASTCVTGNTLEVFPGTYHGCTIDASGDHRIAMAAAIGATVATGPVTVLGAEAVKKSYPKFWEEYRRLGGIL